MQDVVDSSDERLLGARDRFGDPRGGDAEVARRVGEGQTDLGHELDGQGAPDGGDPAPATSLVEFRQTDPGRSAPPANERLHLPPLFRPGGQPRLPRIARR